MSTRPTTDDLRFAIDWLDTYDEGDEHVNGEACERVMTWLRAEVQSREVEAVRSIVQRETGNRPSIAQARKALGFELSPRQQRELAR